MKSAWFYKTKVLPLFEDEMTFSSNCLSIYPEVWNGATINITTV